MFFFAYILGIFLVWVLLFAHIERFSVIHMQGFSCVLLFFPKFLVTFVFIVCIVFFKYVKNAALDKPNNSKSSHKDQHHKIFEIQAQMKLKVGINRT